MSHVKMLKNERLEKVKKKIRVAKVMTLTQLMESLSCSQRSVQRYLREWRCLSSYNHNGKYYVLPDVPRFNRFGIWRYDDIGFSRYGNLKETVLGLIENAKAGMTAAEMGEVMGVNPHSFMSQFRNDPRLRREKRRGRLVYFCSRLEVCEAQRRERILKEPPVALPSDVQAVIILVYLIKNPDATIDELVTNIQKEQKGIEREMVERLLEHHGIQEKKLRTGRGKAP
jgi:hypothetical protein